ncbi:unnamed protein product [Spirodela intermedia]|uniref:Uncharacterized protein n=1 Tax=Spirodela intermedia TaxID=51605 RepID=A0A7I8JZ80_SPIIN|nr:unnamed protein product [Spirodela intermedia]
MWSSGINRDSIACSSTMITGSNRLDRNGLTGPVPPGIGNLTALRELL